MSGRSFSAKNLFVAVIAAIALPLFVPTGAIGFAPSIEKQTLSPTEIEAEIPSAKDGKITQSILFSLSFLSSEPAPASTYLPHHDVNMPEFRVFEALMDDMRDSTLWSRNINDSHPKEGHIMPYCLAAELPAKEIGMDKVPTNRTGLSAIYAPYAVDRSKNQEREKLELDTLCATFLTPFHCFVMVPDKLDDEFTAFFNNAVPTKVWNSSDKISCNIYVFTHPTTDTLPNYVEQIGLATDSVKAAFPSLSVVMNAFQGYLKYNREDGGVKREGVNIFIHWILYFAMNFRAVLQMPTQHERPIEVTNFPPAKSDSGFFFPAFEALFEALLKSE